MSTMIVDNLYVYTPNPNYPTSVYMYLINEKFYYARDLRRVTLNLNPQQCNSFAVDPNGSQILNIVTVERSTMLQQSSGQFVVLEDKTKFKNDRFLYMELFEVPLPNGREINGRFERLRLKNIDNRVLYQIEDLLKSRPPNKKTFERILSLR